MEEAVISVILADNQIDESDFKSNPSQITEIECFHFNLPSHPSFKMFPNLLELRLIEQDITDLSWLSDCPNLACLVVFHTQLSDTQGLTSAPGLKKLILERSQLAQFPDISALPQLEHLSVAGNPIGAIDSFPAHSKLRFLNLSACGIQVLSPTITELSNLSTLLLGGNKLFDYSLFDTLAKHEGLREVNVYDPSYEDNPICKFPNYNVISVGKLPQVQLLDTCAVNERTQTACQRKIAEIKLFYVATFASEMSAAATALGKLTRAANALLAERTSAAFCDPHEIAKIYGVLDVAETAEMQFSEFARRAAMMAFESGDTIGFAKADAGFAIPTGITLDSCATVSAAWRISHLPLASSLPQNVVSTESRFIRLDRLEDSVPLIRNWTATQEFGEVPSVSVDDPVCSIVHCLVQGERLVPESLIFFAETAEQQLEHIDRFCPKNTRNTPQPRSSDTDLVVIKSSFELTETLRYIQLVNCSVESLTFFEGLMELRELRLPFNSIKTLNDLPLLPELQILDVSFNAISEMRNLVIESAALRSNLRDVVIFGNPVCEPKTLRYLSTICPNSVKYMSASSRVFLPVGFDDAEFLKAVIPPKIEQATITIIDVRRLCLSSLAPLAQLPHLLTLFASGNDLTTIDFSSASLEFADFSVNSLSSYPEASRFPQLTTLLMNSNCLTSFDQSLDVSALFVGDNDIASLPSQTLLPNLEVLFVDGNPCAKKYPESRFLFALPKLKMLNGTIVSSQLHAKVDKRFTGVLFPEDLPSVLPPMKTSLDLSGREMKDVNCLSSDHLSDLDLSRNSLAAIEWQSPVLPRLVVLNLSENQLQSLDFLRFLPSLRRLNLSRNELSDALFSSLCQIPLLQLNELDVSGNALRKIEGLPGKNFPLLATLDLSRNHISGISSGALECPQLQTLKLSHNSLRVLNNVGVPTLRNLDVSHNRIPSVDEVEKLRPCTQLETFVFSDNPLVQRVVPRIRCLCLLRTVVEMDGKAVTESDLAQVRTLLEANEGMPPPMISARPAKVNTVILQPTLPQLSAAGSAKRKAPPRFPG
jgi:Leucine-rich repeat (LRR) protein